jgi:mannose-6-phosphate isomerase
MPYDLTACISSGSDCKSSADCCPVKFAPIFRETIWGGDRLKPWFSLNDARPIGEYWLLSAHPSGVSVVADGPLQGMTLNELISRFPEAYLGRSPQNRFPLLIKLIEAADDLSVQVHPDDAYALKAEGDYGKTEAWYILEHGPAAEIVYGHRFADPDHFRRAVKERTVRHFLRRRPIRKDDLVFVPAGTLHAILKGTILLEIQQTSDVTYRVYDWDRVDASGKGRKLHIEQAETVMFSVPPVSRADLQTKKIMADGHVIHEQLLSCPYFTIDRIQAQAGNSCPLSLGKAGNPDVLVILAGEGSVRWGKQHVTFRQGDALLIPASLAQYEIRAARDAKIIRAYY